ncbi:unnamed protein product [Didymodactylos carnosus]|uniref:Methyltransferase domain-containing protein n=1 Tax=Didymodactylos carnosus TaxID=1234261 RepID=A0A8S2CPL6_9BILA|nr:unnamed protein product [Didymodactylos carnosus]CAF3512702.1 unnamed protein product [Didymodactylos carnosus]
MALEKQTSAFIILVAVFGILFGAYLVYSLPLIRFANNIKNRYGTNTINCGLSMNESDHYFCESDSDWIERKNVYIEQDKRNQLKQTTNIFFLTNWEPNFQCRFERRIGSTGDGGKWRLLPNCEIHTFDPGVYQCPVNICTYHQVTLGSGDDNISKSLEMLTNDLNHTKREIDIFKIDIEGGEYSLFLSMFGPTRQNTTKNSKRRVYPRQILFEIHIGGQAPSETHQLFDSLRKYGYVIFHKEPNLIGGADYFEYAMLKLTKKFVTRQKKIAAVPKPKVSFNLRWREHIEDVVLNCRKRLGAMYRQFKGAPSSIRLQIYKTCILAKLNYARALNDNTFASFESQLESVQKLAAHMITCDF